MSGVGDDLDLRAAEYVLGALDPADARAVEALAAHDPALRSSIAAWENRLAPLGETVEPVAPPPELWARLALATGIGGAERREPLRQRPGTLGRVWRSPAVWRAATAGALALAASFAFVAYLPTEPRVAALVAADAAPPAFLVRAESDGRARVVPLAPVTVAAGRDLELWALPDGATRPSSLGVLPAGGRAVRVTAEPGTRLLVSLEPQGGSPTGQPTGPVLYSGVLTAAR